MNADTIEIRLPADMAQMVRRHVESGAYASDSDVIRDALLLWQDQQNARLARLEAIGREIDEAAESQERLSDTELGDHFDRRLAEAESS